MSNFILIKTRSFEQKFAKNAKAGAAPTPHPHDKY